MKTEKRFSAMLLAVAIATSVFGQNPKREVVFTMNANEVIYANEYTLFQRFGLNRFACMTHDTITDKYTFVFNGERIEETRYLYYVNPDEVKGYVFLYNKNGRWYINYRGVVDGGFDDIMYRHDNYYLYTPEKDYDYLYKLIGKWYAGKDGKSKRINFIEKRREGDRYYIYVNGSRVGGPYEDIGRLALTASGKYAYYYRDRNDNYEYCVNVNGSIVGRSYINISGLALTESGKYAYTYYENGKHYLNINGSIVGGHYDYSTIDLVITESGKYAYSYYENGHCVNVNGSTVGGPYNSIINDLTLTEDGKYGYRFHKDRKHYVNTNGVVTEEKDNQFLDPYSYYNDAVDLTSKDGEHSFSSSYEYEYVVIDGRPYGKSPAIEARYDESKNAFVWNAVEGRELVVYEYPLK